MPKKSYQSTKAAGPALPLGLKSGPAAVVQGGARAEGGATAADP